MARPQWHASDYSFERKLYKGYSSSVYKVRERDGPMFLCCAVLATILPCIRKPAPCSRIQAHVCEGFGGSEGRCKVRHRDRSGCYLNPGPMKECAPRRCSPQACAP